MLSPMSVSSGFGDINLENSIKGISMNISNQHSDQSQHMGAQAMGKRPFRTYLKTGLLALIMLVLLFVIILGTTFEGVGGKLTPAGYQRNQATYIPMPDGVQIAADIWYPADLAPNQQVPTILLSTRYWRVQQPGFVSRVLMGLGLIEGINYSVRDAFNKADYAYVLIDARGSGASSGTRELEWSPDEIADMGHVVDWIIAQPWSNGAIGGYGISYDGNTAELLAAINHPAVKATAPFFDRFDPIYNLARPGGVFNEYFISQWREANAIRDKGQHCPDTQRFNLNCLLIKALVGPLKPVDSDENGQQLKQILANRHNSFDVYEATKGLTYREDELAPGLTGTDISPFGLRQEIESSGIPMFIQMSWHDAASVNGTLSRYLTFSNPQQVIIGPWSHGGDEHTDPFLDPETPTDPSEEAQLQAVIQFFDNYLKGEATTPLQSSISYYTLGAGSWQTTTTWPPPGVAEQHWYFAADGTLVSSPPAGAAGTDEYTVDFTASTGEASRWHTPLGGDVVYPDRREEDGKLLTYTSAPLTADLQITGHPIVTLYVASTATDGAFFVYLEDVAPDGRVTYITEGVLRALHRQESEATPPFVPFGPYHSFSAAAGRPLTPGEVTKISFSLIPTSVIIKAGHQIRVAIAGHDASSFAPIAQESKPVITVYRNELYSSAITLPILD